LKRILCYVNQGWCVRRYSFMKKMIRKLIYSERLSFLDRILWDPLRRFDTWRIVNSNKTPVVVYQMGKVASQTIMATLASCKSIHAFHAHMLNPENIKSRRREKETLGGKRVAHAAIQKWLSVYDFVINRSETVKIVTLVREPVGRNISAFFQGLDKRVGVVEAHKNASLQILIDKFLSGYPHTRPLSWFDDELLATTGIDVYLHPFPKDCGYQRIQQGRFDVLILRHDLPDTQKANCLSEFLDIPNMMVARDNLAENKTYHDCYCEFQKSIRLSPEYVEEMLESKYARHFFPDEEREMLRRKWLRLDDTRASGRETGKDTVMRQVGD
jgi:Putative capsular polysaccharide synthesis protein/Sulfotransferase family